MLPNSTMGDELRFQQRWEFRKRDNDFESSSDDSKSHSSSEPAFKKHKLVSSFISCENDETGDSPTQVTVQQQNADETNPDAGDQNKTGKAKRVQRGRSRKDKLVSNGIKEKGARKGSRRGNSTKTSTYEPAAALNGLKMFMESVLDDLKGTRENLFAWMQDEMHKLVGDGNAPQPTQREGCYAEENTEVLPQNNVQENVELQQQKQPASRGKVKRPIRSKKSAKSGNSSQAIEDDQVGNFGRATGPKKSTKKDKGTALESSVKPNVESNPSDQNDQQQLQNNLGLISTQAQNCNGGSLERSVERRNNIGSSNSLRVLENHADLDQVARSMASAEKEGEERLSLSTHPYCSSDQNALLQHQNNFESGIKLPNNNGGSLERFVKDKKTDGFNQCYQVLEDRVDYGQGIRSAITPNGKDNIERRFGVSCKPNILSNPSGQPHSSMYLTLPTVLTEPHFENNNRLDLPSSCTNMQLRMSGNNRMEVNLERANPMLDHASARHHPYFQGLQQEERVGKFTPLSYSSTGNRFPVPLHQVMDGGFSIPSQAAIRFLGENHALPGHHVSNNFNSNLNYKVDSGLLAFQTPDFKDGRLLPK